MNDFSKKYNIRYFLLFTIMVMIIIHILYKISAPIQQLEYVIEPGELLAYVGTMLLGYIAIKQNHQMYKLTLKALDLSEIEKKVFLEINKNDCELKKVQPVDWYTIIFENITKNNIASFEVKYSDKVLYPDGNVGSSKEKKYELQIWSNIGAINTPIITQIENQNCKLMFPLNYNKEKECHVLFLAKTCSIYGISNEQYFDVIIMNGKVQDYYVKVKEY